MKCQTYFSMAQNSRTSDAIHRNATKYFLYDPVVGAEEGIRKRIVI